MTGQWKNKDHNASRVCCILGKQENHCGLTRMSKYFSGGHLKKGLMVTVRTLNFILNMISSHLKVLSKGMPYCTAHVKDQFLYYSESRLNRK